MRNRIPRTSRGCARTALRAAAAACAAALWVSSAPAQAPAADPKFDPARLTTPPLRPIPKVTPERLVLKNGIVVYLLEDHDLPVVQGTAYVRATPLWVPDDKVGLGTIVGEAMRSGGAAAHSGDWLDDRLGALGASISTGMETDFATAGFRALTENAGEVIGLWAEILREPALPEEKIELARVGLRREIASRNDEMFPLVGRVLTQAVYGRNSPWARVPEYATVEAVTRDDCLALYRKVFEPGRLVVAVYGDFATADMKKLLESHLGQWQGAGQPLPPQPPVPDDARPRLVFAPKEDVTQSGIVLGQLGFRTDDPDYPAMDVYQTALGSGSASRLMNEIRTRRGLAYFTGARAGDDYLRPGVFLAFTLTRGDSTLTALELLRSEVTKTVDAPFTADELTQAKNATENSFVFKFEKPSSVLWRAAFYEMLGYPQDFLQRYQQGLQQVTAQSVLDAARRKVHPDRFVAIVVGKEKDFDRPLESAGLPVERVDISIPPPPSSIPTGPASAQSLAQGQEWLRKAGDLAGGSAAWKAIKTVRMEMSATLTMQGQSMPLTSSTSWALPDRVLVIQRLPFGEMKQGCDGTNGWISAGGQVKDEPKAVRGVKEEWERSLFRLFGVPEGVSVQAAEAPRTIDGVTYQVAYVKSDLVRDWTLLFAPDGSLARMEFQGEGPMGPAKQTEVYSDWQAVGKVKYPHAQKLLLNGDPFMDQKVTTATFDGPIDEASFKKPGS
jgi:zinc protease